MREHMLLVRSLQQEGLVEAEHERVFQERELILAHDVRLEDHEAAKRKYGAQECACLLVRSL